MVINFEVISVEKKILQAWHKAVSTTDKSILNLVNSNQTWICNSTFPIDLPPNGNSFGAKSIGFHSSSEKYAYNP